jgi:hypothetical protein
VLQVVPADAHQWEVHNDDRVKASTPYELYNQKNSRQLGYENRMRSTRSRSTKVGSHTSGPSAATRAAIS